MNPTITEALKIVGSRVLEDWAMMMIEPGNASISDLHNGPVYLASMNFKNNEGLSGCVYVACERPFISILWENVLGETLDDQAENSLVEDAVKEFANVLTGNFVTEFYGEDEAFELLSPQVVIQDLKEIKKHFSDGPVNFSADGQLVFLACSLKQEG